MLKIQVQGHDFIIDVVNVDSMEEPEGDRTMCLAKVGDVTFQYATTAEKAFAMFKSDLSKAITVGEVRPRRPQPVPFLVVQYSNGFKIDWAFHERHVRAALMPAQVEAGEHKGIANAVSGCAAGGSSIN